MNLNTQGCRLSLQDFVKEGDEVFKIVFLREGIVSAVVIESGSSASVVDGGNFISSVDDKVINVVGITSTSLDDSLDLFSFLNIWDSLIDIHAFCLVDRISIGEIREMLAVFVLELPLEDKTSLISHADSAGVWGAFWSRRERWCNDCWGGSNTKVSIVIFNGKVREGNFSSNITWDCDVTDLL